MNRRMERLIPDDDYGNETAERTESFEDMAVRVGVSLDDLAERVETLERRIAALLARTGGAS